MLVWQESRQYEGYLYSIKEFINQWFDACVTLPNPDDPDVCPGCLEEFSDEYPKVSLSTNGEIYNETQITFVQIKTFICSDCHQDVCRQDDCQSDCQKSGNCILNN